MASFDAKLSGTNDYSWNVKIGIWDKYKPILLSLINQTLEGRDEDPENAHKFDEYVLTSFKCFCRNKKSITINLPITPKIEYLFHKKDGQTRKRNAKKLRADNDPSNLVKPLFLRLFKNLKSLTIITRDGMHDKYRPVSMKILLALIKDTRLREVRILNYGGPQKHIPGGSVNKSGMKFAYQSWITHLWKKQKSELIEMYGKEDFKIEKKNAIGFMQYYHGFIITAK